MEVNNNETKIVSGVVFRLVDVGDADWKDSKEYILHLKNDFSKTEFVSLHKFVRMFAWPYRIVLVREKEKDCIAFLIYPADEEEQEMNTLMRWIEEVHPEWSVAPMKSMVEKTSVVGVHIPNSRFHERRLLLQGEVFD